MSILCSLGGHEAGNEEIYNGGYYFGCCRRCGRDMIRAGPAWQVVPQGHRVVWKAGRHHSHSIEPDYAPVLPTLHKDSNLPAVRPAFASWSRALSGGFGRASAPAGGARAAVSAAEPEEPAYPRLLVLAALVGAGIQLFLSLGSGRSGIG